MSELRQDPTTGAWVIITPARGRRPQDWQAVKASRAETPGTPPPCPFCPGNESLLASIVEEIPQEAPPFWRIRVVPNRYPLVSGGGTPTRRIAGGHVMIEAHGSHEVIIENPRHDADLATLPEDDIAAVVAIYQRRYRSIMAQPGVRSALVFRNHGERAGASLRHPHSQIVGVAVTPPKLRAMARWGRDRHRASGRCATCDELERERRSGTRIVEETESLIALVPFAAASPYELWLVPKRHTASFGTADGRELADLASLLGRSLRRLSGAIGPVSYNFVIESATDRLSDAPYLHWRLRIVPDLVMAAGFELGSGLAINPSLPEADAEALRHAVPR